MDAIAGGGGLISLPAYIFAGVSTHMALGTNKLSNTMGTAIATIRYAMKGYMVRAFVLTTNLAASLVFLLNGSIFLSLGIVAGVFNIAGNWLGSQSFIGKGSAIVRPIMLVVIGLFACKLVFDLVVP